MGVDGVVPFGANGEGPSVVLREKLAVIEALFESAPPVLAPPPYSYTPKPAEGLKRFFKPVLASTRHPVIVYHIPKYAVPIPEEVVEGLPVWGVKDSGGEPGYAEAILEMGRGVLIGTEDDLWKRLNLGAQGVISALANFIPEEILEMNRKVREGDEARSE